MWPMIIASVLVVAMLVGPIMMLQPSRRQRELARVRLLAAKHSMAVKLVQNPASGEPRQLAVYSRGVEDCRTYGGRKPAPWILARQHLEHELNFASGWDWVGEKRAPAALQEILKPWLTALPAPIRAVEVTAQTVGFYWTEACWQHEADPEDAMQACIEYLDAEIYWLVAQTTG